MGEDTLFGKKQEAKRGTILAAGSLLAALSTTAGWQIAENVVYRGETALREQLAAQELTFEKHAAVLAKEYERSLNQCRADLTESKKANLDLLCQIGGTCIDTPISADQ